MFVNADCRQDNCCAFRKHGNHKTIDNNRAMIVHKTLLKEVSRGCSLMLDPDIVDFLENTKQTPHGILHFDHLTKSPRVACDASCHPKHWCHGTND